MKRTKYIMMLLLSLFCTGLITTGQNLTTIAGNGTAANTGDNGLSTAAQVFFPACVAADAAGNVYTGVLGNRIRKITTGTNIISTYVGTGVNGFSGDGGASAAATISNIRDIATDAAGNIYFTDGSRIRKVTVATGIITTIAGTGVPSSSGGYTGDGGLATLAQLGYAQGIAVDAAGNIYYTEYAAQATVRKIDAITGMINTIAGVPGTASLGYSGDGGPATAAHLSSPWDIAVDVAGNVYIADYSNSRIRKVNAITGIITTIAGTGIGGFSGDGGPATAANITAMGIIVDPGNNIYFTGADHRVRRIDGVTGIITTIAGTGIAGFAGNNGPATAAQLNGPANLAMDGAGNIYIADQFNSRVRKIPVSCASVTPGTISGTGANPSCGTASSTLTLTGATATGVAYQWKASSDNISWTNVGTSSTSYATGTISTTMHYKAVVSCSSGSLKDSTPVYTLTVNPMVTPTVSITAAPGNVICSGTPVTFTATITNGGTMPVFQWKKGTANVGTGGTTYTDNTLANGNIITVELTSNALCSTAPSVTSNAVTMTVKQPTASTVTRSICSNALPYLWNGISVTAGGSNAATYTTTNAAGCDSVVTLSLTVNNTVASTANLSICNNQLPYLWNGIAVTAGGQAAATFTTVNMAGCDSVVTLNLTVNPVLTPAVTITAAPGNVICSGTPVTFTAAVVNGGTNPSFQWKKGTSAVGTNSPSYTSNTLANGDVITVVVTGNALCSTTPAVTSNSITLTVGSPSTAVVNRAICNNQLPYLWNGISVPAGGTSAATYSTTNASGCDSTVTLNLMVHNASVATANLTICSNQLPYTWNGLSVTAGGSNAAIFTTLNTAGCDSVVTLNLTVNPAIVPSVTITASPGTIITAGTPVTFLATTVNAGSSPVYVWKKNGMVVGTNSNMYTDAALNNADVITCTLQSSLPCVAPATVTDEETIYINIPPVSCPAPSSLVTTEVSFTSVKFTWSAVAGAAGYEYVLDHTPSDPSSSGTFITSAFYQAGMLSNGEYYFHLRTRCATGNYSPWIRIKVTISDGTTGINGISAGASRMQLYPNPNKGVFTVEGGVMAAAVAIDIANYAGQSVYRGIENTPAGKLKKEIRLTEPIASGAYLLRILSPEEVLVIRFVITK